MWLQLHGHSYSSTHRRQTVPRGRGVAGERLLHETAHWWQWNGDSTARKPKQDKADAVRSSTEEALTLRKATRRKSLVLKTRTETDRARHRPDESLTTEVLPIPVWWLWCCWGFGDFFLSPFFHLSGLLFWVYNRDPNSLAEVRTATTRAALSRYSRDFIW